MSYRPIINLTDSVLYLLILNDCDPIPLDSLLRMLYLSERIFLFQEGELMFRHTNERSCLMSLDAVTEKILMPEIGVHLMGISPWDENLKKDFEEYLLKWLDLPKVKTPYKPPRIGLNTKTMSRRKFLKKTRKGGFERMDNVLVTIDPLSMCVLEDAYNGWNKERYPELEFPAGEIKIEDLMRLHGFPQWKIDYTKLKLNNQWDYEVLMKKLD